MKVSVGVFCIVDGSKILNSEYIDVEISEHERNGENSLVLSSDSFDDIFLTHCVIDGENVLGLVSCHPDTGEQIYTKVISLEE